MEERYRVWFAREDLNRFEPDHGWRNTGRANISRIFRWYEGDYTGENSIKNILERFGPSAYKDMFEAGEYSIRYKSYDWGLNDQGTTGEDYRHNPLRGVF